MSKKEAEHTRTLFPLCLIGLSLGHFISSRGATVHPQPGASYTLK